MRSLAISLVFTAFAFALFVPTQAHAQFCSPNFGMHREHHGILSGIGHAIRRVGRELEWDLARATAPRGYGGCGGYGGYGGYGAPVNYSTPYYNPTMYTAPIVSGYNPMMYGGGGGGGRCGRRCR